MTCHGTLLKIYFHSQIDILCNDELLGKDHTLKFVYVTRWRFKGMHDFKIIFFICSSKLLIVVIFSDPPLRLQYRTTIFD